MEIINFRKNGFSLLEFCLALCVLLPLIYNILGILEYYRLSYLLEENINNVFGNRKMFVLKLDENFSVTQSSVNDLKILLSVKINELKKQNNNCDIQYSGDLFEKEFHNVKSFDKHFVKIQGDIDFKKCARIGGDFLKIIPNTISIKKFLTVTYEF